MTLPNRISEAYFANSTIGERICYMRLVLVSGLVLLAACSTPQERCISGVSKELRVVDQLISTTRGNLARGFAIEEKSVLVNTDQVCGQTAEGDDIICEIAVAEDKRVPVAIDLDAEQSKLNSLVARRAELASLRSKRIEQCIATHPE